MSGSTVNILHLSDLHFGAEPYKDVKAPTLELRKTVLDNLLTELQNNQGCQPDIVVITGDIAWKAAKDDYAKAAAWLQLLSEKLKLDMNRFILCPGNHDIDRMMAKSKLPPTTQEDINELFDFAQNPYAISDYSAPFQRYIEFCKGIGIPPLENGTSIDDTKYLFGYRSILDIGFVVLNSAWNCRDDEDKGRLILAQPLVTDARRMLGEHRPRHTVTLFHHPKEFLLQLETATYTVKDSYQKVAEFSDMILNGHIHAMIQKPDRIGSASLVFTSGATYEKHDQYNAVEIIKVNLDGGHYTQDILEWDFGRELWRHESLVSRGAIKAGPPKEHAPVSATPVQPKTEFSAHIDIAVESLNKDFGIDRSKQLFHYKSSGIPFEGRGREIKIIQRFLECEGDVKVLPVTGYGGSGKSRLVREFIRTHLGEGWAAAYIDWNDFSSMSLNKKIDYGYHKKLLLVLDYVLAGAKEIGEWVDRMLRYRSTICNPIRLVIIEREPYNEENVPLWYEQMVIANKIKENLFDTFIYLERLANDELVAIVRNYLKAKGNDALKVLSDEKIEKNILQPLQSVIDPVHCRPIFALYIAEAWLQSGDVRKWDKEALLDWINDNEKKRHSQLLGHDPALKESLSNLLSYATAITHLDRESLPVFLKPEWQALKAGPNTLQALFNALNTNPHTYVCLEGMTPDLLGEYFCLQHLLQKWNNDEPEFIQSFVEACWQTSPESFFSFLNRVAADFPEHILTGFTALYQEPAGEPGIWYARFLFTLTYRGSLEKMNQAISRLEQYYQQSDGEKVLASLYAKGLVNLSGVYKEIGKKEECIDKLEALVRDGEQELLHAYAHGLFNLLIAYKEIEKKEECIDKLEALAKDGDQELLRTYARSLVNLSSAHEETGKVEECIDKLEALTRGGEQELLHAYAHGLVNLSSAYEEIGKIEGCIDKLETLAEDGDQKLLRAYAKGLVNLSGAHEEIDKIEECIDKLEALARGGDQKLLRAYAKGLVNLSGAHEEIGKIEECIDKLEALAKDGDQELLRTYAKGLVNLSYAYGEIGKIEECIDKLEALARGGDQELLYEYANGLVNLSSAYEEIGKTEGCIDKLEALAKDGDQELLCAYAKGLVNLLSVYKEIEKKEECLRKLEVLAKDGDQKLLPVYANGLLSCGLFYYKSMRLGKAEGYFKKAYQADDSNENAGINLAYMLRRGETVQDYPKSVEQFLEEGLQKNTSFACVNMALYLSLHKKDWWLADGYISHIKRDDGLAGVISWWSDLWDARDPEGLLVLMWLKRHGLYSMDQRLHNSNAFLLAKEYPGIPKWTFESAKAKKKRKRKHR